YTRGCRLGKRRGVQNKCRRALEAGRIQNNRRYIDHSRYRRIHFVTRYLQRHEPACLSVRRRLFAPVFTSAFSVAAQRSYNSHWIRGSASHIFWPGHFYPIYTPPTRQKKQHPLCRPIVLSATLP